MDGCVKVHVRRSRQNFEAAFAHHGFRSVDGDGDDGRAGFHGEIEGAFFERLEAAVGGACAFDKRDNVDTGGEDAGSNFDTGGGFSAAIAIDGDEVGAAHAVAEDGDVHERALEERGEAAGD